MKFPSFSQWKQIFKVLSKVEKITLIVFFTLAISSFVFLSASFYISHTKIVPATGGTFVEGVMGQPRFINPLYGETNDTDRTLISLIFSGLMTYDNSGKIVKDLVDNYKISDDGKTYTFTLKDNILWHDRIPLTADDVIFTIQTIQNSDYKSPLRANWVDVDAKKLSDKSFSFTLKQPYNSFLENCTVKIIPSHIWKNIAPENFTLSLYNLQPVGSGPFAFKNLTQTNAGFIETLNLQSNRRYHNKASFISNISFKFFEKTEDLVRAANARKVDGFSFSSSDANEQEMEKQIRQERLGSEKFITHSFSLPRYFAVFFNNQKTSIFSDVNIRKALTYSVDKNDLEQKIDSENPDGQKISMVDSPILPDFFHYKKPANAYGFDIKKANDLLDKSGFLAKGESASGGKPDESGQRTKTTTKKPSFQFKSYLKVGSKNTEVAQLQGCLSSLSDDFKNLLSSETNGSYGKSTEYVVTEFQKKYLPELAPTGETGSSTRKKLNELCNAPTQNVQPLGFTLVTINQPQLVKVANLLKNYWQQVGVSVDIQAVSITELKPIIKNRRYDALLYGQALGMNPDLYPFWYSSQKLDPGLNLSSYENKEVDKLLKDARQTLEDSQKQQYLEKIQELIINDAPALFLYNPDYTYWVSQKVQGVDTTRVADPSKRFSNITNWFIGTKRVWR